MLSNAMKTPFSYIVYTSFLLGISVLLYEIYFCMQTVNEISHGKSFLPASSHTLETAKSVPDFAKTQLKASKKRIGHITADIFKHVTVLCISLMILNQSVKKQAQKGISAVIELFPKVIGSSSRMKEISFVSLTTTLLIAAAFSFKPIFFKPTQDETMLPITIAVYLFIGFILVPCVYAIMSKLLKVYAGRLIAACYLAYFVKSLSEFITVEEINLKTMKKIDISEFSIGVVDYLKERHLEDSVFGEKKKSDTLNAALVGWGSSERIEIYGDHKSLSEREFESVLMHEIGHSQDYSLYKKLAVLFAVKLIEMAIILQIFFRFSEDYSDEFISKYASFSLLFVVFFLLIDRWLLLFHKMMSQTAENAADLIAKVHGYSNELSKVLFDITVKGETAIRSTWLYNAVRSYHPTVYERIERLNSN